MNAARLRWCCGLLLSGLFAVPCPVMARGTSKPEPFSQRMADKAMLQWPQSDSHIHPLLLQSMTAIWLASASPVYYRYAKQSIDQQLTRDSLLGEGNLNDRMSRLGILGSQLLLLSGVTGEVKYYAAAEKLHQLSESIKASEGNPFQAATFEAEYADTLQDSSAYDEIATDLLHVSEPERETASYIVSLVDTLPNYPEQGVKRGELLAALNKTAEALRKHQDSASGLWNLQTRTTEGNSNLLNSCLISYAMEKAVRLGYLPNNFQSVGKRGYRGAMRHLKRMAGDAESTGAFLMASVEDEISATALLGHGDTVLLDAWFNSQKKNNVAGKTVFFHYKWNDLADSGYSFFGNAFMRYGVKTETLYTAPTKENLSRAQIYIIPSPDIPIKNPNPNYVSTKDADVVAAWVSQGGVLVLMENDGKNSEFEHLNQLSERFGIRFNPVVNNQVPGDDFEKGTILIPANGAMFLRSHKAFMKDICSITVSSPARSTLEWQGNTVMAVTKYGRGSVYAVVDPWLYNEYTDGRKLPSDFDNFSAAEDLVRRLVQQVSPQTRAQ